MPGKPNDLTRLDPGFRQRPRKPFDLKLKLGIPHHRVVGDERRRIGPSPGLPVNGFDDIHSCKRAARTPESPPCFSIRRARAQRSTRMPVRRMMVSYFA